MGSGTIHREHLVSQWLAEAPQLWLPELMKVAFIAGAVVLVVCLVLIVSRLRLRSPKTAALWSEGESIYDFINRNLDATGAVRANARDLPDEKKRSKPGGLKWVAGGFDGTFGHHGGGEQAKQKATQVASLVASIARTGSVDAQRDLYAILQQDSVLDFLDAAIEQMVQQRTPVTDPLRQFAVNLATRSPDREPVKFALSLLGVIRDQKNVDVIALLGRHEEFTLFAAVALTNTLPDPEPALFDLAQRVHGWGRIHVVERLADTNNPEIKRWLLLRGYDNNVMHEYLAFICATSGDLDRALAAKEVDGETLNASTDLLRALVAGGPARDINDYAQAAPVVSDYLRHIEHRPLRLGYFGVVESIADYVSSSSWDPTAREKNGWSEERRKAVLVSAQAYLQRPEWTDLVRGGLQSEEWSTFDAANNAAKRLGIDTWQTHWRRVQADPTDASRWFQVMEQANAERIDGIVALAASTLPLQQIASGPSDSMGLGPEFKAHSALDMVLQSLERFSGKGKPLVLAGLRSPVIRNRNMAIKALAGWRADDRDAEISAALRRADAEEPQADVKARIERVIAGKALN